MPYTLNFPNPNLRAFSGSVLADSMGLRQQSGQLRVATIQTLQDRRNRLTDLLGRIQQREEARAARGEAESQAKKRGAATGGGVGAGLGLLVGGLPGLIIGGALGAGAGGALASPEYPDTAAQGLGFGLQTYSAASSLFEQNIIHGGAGLGTGSISFPFSPIR